MGSEQVVSATEGELVAGEIAKAAGFANLGMYEYFNEEEFPLLSKEPKKLSVYVLLAFGAAYNNITSAASVVVGDEKAFKRLMEERERILEQAKEIAKNIYPEDPNLPQIPPMFFGDQDTRDEISWYVENGFVGLVNEENIRGLTRVGSEVISLLKARATQRRNEILSSTKSKAAISLNGHNK